MTKKHCVRFKVWEGNAGFYAHMIAGNSRIVWVTESYGTRASAFKACESTWRWIGIEVGFGDIKTLPPVPYTKDSLVPLERKMS